MQIPYRQSPEYLHRWQPPPLNIQSPYTPTWPPFLPKALRNHFFRLSRHLLLQLPVIFTLHAYNFRFQNSGILIDDQSGQSSTLDAAGINALAVFVDVQAAMGIVAVDDG